MLTEPIMQEKRESHEFERRTARKLRARTRVPIGLYRNRMRGVQRPAEEGLIGRKIAISHAIAAAQEVKKTSFFSDLNASVRGIFRGVR